MAVSNNITGALNFVAMILSVSIIGRGIWLATREDAECALWMPSGVSNISSDIFDIDASLHFSVVTNKGGGHTVPSRNYKEYQINDFSGWLRNYVEKCSHWNRIERCLSSSEERRKLNQKYLSAQYFFNAHLTPLEIIWG
ncbi:hypothetical protein SUGI_1138400 [Cryptomeria japonica]|uniref:protein TORNADO 2-like n=1 Tax=Cryptomeria japonica TaxID=3369 RepID=UPI002414A268|nr:protein TORNADO 2-like [Cryptomeria japonica]GLJ53385.1 hypothetical protein SUGI_1138400 [Cryptomeria japonica]